MGPTALARRPKATKARLPWKRPAPVGAPRLLGAEGLHYRGRGRGVPAPPLVRAPRFVERDARSPRLAQPRHGPHAHPAGAVARCGRRSGSTPRGPARVPRTAPVRAPPATLRRGRPSRPTPSPWRACGPSSALRRRLGPSIAPGPRGRSRQGPCLRSTPQSALARLALQGSRRAPRSPGPGGSMTRAPRAQPQGRAASPPDRPRPRRGRGLWFACIA